MALQTDLSGISPLQVPNLHNISHDIMAYQAFASATSALWSAGGNGISQIYVVYSFKSLLWVWQFQVAVIAFTLLIFAAKFYAIKSNANARNRETRDSKQRDCEQRTDCLDADGDPK
ncbi:hypothetical protein B0H67DRAFT_645679 [Lasiosphaeris hirsuta]|uniref:Uncharacterized protein n=1 Tax=Lasiosphaeris hirsuta TaxID=260670 RepID=A0AA40DWU9_9PEZI|nr:hypothetical protein B0H67DRAFT_645679 [Lasiosphaeris hirsuta]